MTEQNGTMTSLTALLGEDLLSIESHQGEITATVESSAWHRVARTLRDDPDCQYEQMVDLCGVDYLGYGQDEWENDDATFEGFSRAVEGTAGPGRFDWAERIEAGTEERFAVVIHLLSVTHNRRLRVRTMLKGDQLPVVASLIDVWAAADWYEREAFDLYGILFNGHPDLRRILTDYGFVGHPFRKDFPLIGNVEVIYDEQQQRVVYQPVTIEPRVLVPKVVRHDSRYLADEE